MSNKKRRSSTKFVFNIGYVLIAYTLVVITYGMSSGLVTPDNFVPVILAVLGAGVSFFGINLARVTAENVYSVRSTAELAAATPYMPEATELTSPYGTVKVEQTAEVSQGSPQYPGMGQLEDNPVGEQR